MIKIIRRKQKLDTLGISKTTNHEKEKNGESCKPFKIGRRAAGYIEQHVQAEAAALSRNYTPNQMRELVKKLETQSEQKLAELLAKIDSNSELGG